jgi:hypothetical protein
MKADAGRLRSLAMQDAVPAFVWAGAFALLAAVCAAALPWLGATYDFYRGGTIQGHVTERSAMPLLVAQNGAGNMLLFVALAGCYWLAFAAYERLLRRFEPRVAVAAFAAGALAAVALPVLPTSDPYAYALYALEVALHLNPYVAHASGLTGPWAASLSTLFPNSHAPVRVCYYGPVFALAYGALGALLQHAPLLVFLLAERMLGVLCIALAALGFAFAVPGETGAGRARRAFAFALHPLVVLEFVAFAHGDGMMLAALAWAYAAWRRGRVASAGALCAVAVCTRSVALVAVAALLVVLVRSDRRAALRAAGGFAATMAGLALLSELRLGAFSIGGQQAFFSPTSAPLIVVASFLLPVSQPMLGLYLEELSGVVLMGALFWRVLRGGSPDLLAWLPFAMFAGVPGLYGHYVAWASPLQSLSTDARLLRVFRTLCLVAPLLYLTHLDPFAAPGAPLSIQLLVLAAVWVPVLLAFREPSPRAITTSS